MHFKATFFQPFSFADFLNGFDLFFIPEVTERCGYLLDRILGHVKSPKADPEISRQCGWR
jgi:hypothetical protein